MTKDSQHDDRDDRRVWSKIDLVKLSAGTLAAISSAVCASWLGVTGTIVGAALASVIATIGQELYAHSLKHAHKRLQGVRLEQALAVVGATGRPPPLFTRAAPAPAPRDADATVTPDPAASFLAPAVTDAASGGAADGEGFVIHDRRAISRSSSDGTAPDNTVTDGAVTDHVSPDHAVSGRMEQDTTSPAARARSAATPDDAEPAAHDPGLRTHWMRLGLATVAMFVFAMLAITAFELLAGDSLAGLFGDGSAGATTLPFGTGGGDPAPEFTPVPPIETLPAETASTAPSSDAPQSTAPAETPSATAPAPSTGTEPLPDTTGDPVTPPGDAGTPAEEAPAAGDAPIG